MIIQFSNNIFFCILFKIRPIFLIAGRSFSTSIPILILTGVWEFTSFLLSNYYTTLLISYVTAPNPQPMIKSIYELQNRPDLRVVIDKGIPSEVVISVFILIY